MSEITSRMVEAAFNAPQISEWEKHRQLITELYKGQGKPLREVKRYLEVRHGFIASERMYKQRVRTWNLKKNIKHKDREEVLQYYTEDEVEKAVQTSGDSNPVPPTKVLRYVGRDQATKSPADEGKLSSECSERRFLPQPSRMITNSPDSRPIRPHEPAESGIDCPSPIRSQRSPPSAPTALRPCPNPQQPAPVGLPKLSNRPISDGACTPKNSLYESDGEESDARRKRRKLSTPSSTVPLEMRALACPFYKHNPLRYNPSTMRFRTCAGPGWDSISRLRQHLLRAHRNDPVLAKHYELYSFNNRDGRWEVDGVEVAAPQEKLAKIVSDRERNSLLLQPLKDMDPGRRALIDGLLKQKNIYEGSREAQFRCAFVESFGPSQRENGGERIKENEKMDVIIAQHITPQAGSASQELILPSESITEEQEQELKQKQPAKLTREENWQRIYLVLFPYDSSSPSPYYEIGSDASMSALLAGPSSDRLDSLVQHLCKTLPQKILTGLKGQPRSHPLHIAMKLPTEPTQLAVVDDDDVQQPFREQSRGSAEDASSEPQLSTSVNDLKTLISDSITETCTEWLRNRNEEDDESDQELAVDDEQNHAVSTSATKAYDMWALSSLASEVQGYLERDSAISGCATLIDPGGRGAENFDQPQAEVAMTEPLADLSLNNIPSSLNMDSNFNAASASSYDFSYLPMSPGIPFLDPSAQLEWEPTTSIEDMEQRPTSLIGDMEVESTTTSKDTGTCDFQLNSFLHTTGNTGLDS